jgi:peptidoglycan hydrolase-like protein with peptidoglycan-binding domain
MRPLNQIRRWWRIGLVSLLCLPVHDFAMAQTEASTVPKKPAHASAAPAKKHHASGQTSTKGKGSHRRKGARKRGQQAIDSTRAREIQEALIREHYMQGEPSGTWDAATQAAMQRYQADQGWQSKQIPDSRALIKLGLGPSHDHLLNPESAMTMPTAPAAADPKPADPKAAAKQPPTDNNLPRP